jgi:histidine triad (HIT) family protein
MSYDPENVFAKILKGEIPCHKIYEDEDSFAFMDVMPQGTGHALVIPKAPSENLLTATPEALSQLIKTVQKVAQAALEAFEADGVLVQQFNNPAAGQTVFHTHFHVLPRFEGISLKPHSGEMADGEMLAAHADKYRAVLEARG